MSHKVLLVDDGNERIEHLVGGLRTAGYQVILTQNSTLPALQNQIKEHKPQFLMLDEDNVYDLSDKDFNLDAVAAA
jgi:hypothetical protein